MRLAALALVMVVCGGDAGMVPLARATPARATPVRRLTEAARDARLAVPVAFTADGAGWIGAEDDELVVHADGAEAHRIPGGTGATTLAAFPGGWIVGARVLAPDGAVRFDGYQWAQRYGRSGTPRAAAVSPDGRVVIIDGADAPSRCLCDRGRGSEGGWAGALVRVTLGGARPVERVLIEHADRVDYQLAASARWVAAVAGRDLAVWPAIGRGAATRVSLAAGEVTMLRWHADRYLVAVRYVDEDRAEVQVLDRRAGYRPTWTWSVEGSVEDVQVRPGTGELAIATTRYRATDHVLVDQRRVTVFGLDGTVRAEVDTVGYPASVAWSPRGDALLVATTGSAAGEAAVVRFAVE